MILTSHLSFILFLFLFLFPFSFSSFLPFYLHYLFILPSILIFPSPPFLPSLFLFDLIYSITIDTNNTSHLLFFLCFPHPPILTLVHGLLSVQSSPPRT
ncbi:hypothetical protein BCR41DRAFT_348723 [Lobosporangium transversale]|uniref:Uncharacterized protein n=1 Tax=Lobosporangium transversale TaxID=64571 RepID=A0A1Y2GZ98_9FUNG|nr:hypothetical protein BCR41DRAFT_348723 [Lobosporangium transversale]ORZ24916.1 hypothetical protein BCR41DRAFT_348723 [Lobosporangium transversale]|eukprot:XP_021883897.1 hypothetical protein BCR41DRAFT_348723 [Lobosporangium transversale]